MADVTPPPSQMDTSHTLANRDGESTAVQPASDQRYSDNDGMQFFDFDAFGNDATQLQAQSEKDLYLSDVEMDAEYDAPETDGHDPDLPMYDDTYHEIVPEGKPDEAFASGEEETDQEVSDDDDDEAALFQAALESYRHDNPLRSHLIPQAAKVSERELADPPGVIHLESPADPKTLVGNEKWQVDRESAEFLASVMSLVSDHDFEETLQRSTRNSLRRHKLEEPVIHVHPQMEMMRMLKRNEVHLSSEGIDEIPLDTEKDEGLSWSEEAIKLPHKLRGEIMKARLELDRESIEYLRDILEEPNVDLDDWLKQDRERRLPPSPLSPKLLPLSPPYSPGGIDPTAAEVELTSSPEDPAVHEANEISAKLLDQDNIRMQKGAERTTDALDGFTASSSSPLQRKAKRRQDLKVSSPLMPLEDPEPPAKKAKIVGFSDELGTLVPSPSEDDLFDTADVQDEFTVAMESMKPSVESEVQQRLLNDELDEADTTLRMAVPGLEQVTATPPWETYADSEGNSPCLDSQRRLLEEALKELSHAETKWNVSSKIERELQWLPFPLHLGKVKLEGDFDDGSLARYMRELDLDDDVDLERLTWKPEGLRVLDCDEDEDDELEVAEFDSDDESSDEEAHASSRTPIAPATLPKEKQYVRNAPAALNPPVCSTKGWTSMDALLQKRKIQLEEDKKAMTNESSLDMFARIQGLSNAAAPMPATEAPLNRSPPTKLLRDPEVDQRIHSPSTNEELPVPAAEIQLSERPLQIIMSFAIMQNHQFVRRLQKHLPGIELIDRDFTAMSDGSVSKPSAVNISQEADIAMSPSTGLVLTNLQKLKQKPLPGQSSLSGIREQIRLIAPRYERLIVLVSDRPTMDDNHSQPHIIDGNDSAALTDFINQTAVLETDVKVVYVTGGVDMLVKWAAATISRTASGEHKLLRDETTWERFLRKAGMNSYAAQVVLDSLKPPTLDPARDSSRTLPSTDGSASALASFVMMSAEERIQRFGPMMGGDGLLRRINRMLHARWTTF